MSDKAKVEALNPATDADGKLLLTAEEANAILRECFTEISVGLYQFVRTSIETTNDLFEMNDFVSDSDALGFRAKRDEWLTRFQQTWQELFDKRLSGVRRQGRRPDFDASLNTLRVLNAFDQEKQAALTAATQALARLTKREVDALDLRVGVLLREPRARDVDNPFGPSYILDAIGLSSRAVYPNPRVWRPLMERVLADLTPGANKSFIKGNRFLAERHVLPEIKAELRARSELRPRDDAELLPTFFRLFKEAGSSAAEELLALDIQIPAASDPAAATAGVSANLSMGLPPVHPGGPSVRPVEPGTGTVEARPVSSDGSPATAERGEGRPGDPAGQTGPGHVGAGHVGAGHVGPGHAGPGHVGPGHVGPGHVGPGHVGPGHVGPGHVGPGHVGPGHAGPGHAGPGHAGPGHVGPGHAGPGHAGPAPSGSAQEGFVQGAAGQAGSDSYAPGKGSSLHSPAPNATPGQLAAVAPLPAGAHAVSPHAISPTSPETSPQRPMPGPADEAPTVAPWQISAVGHASGWTAAANPYAADLALVPVAAGDGPAPNAFGLPQLDPMLALGSLSAAIAVLDRWQRADPGTGSQLQSSETESDYAAPPPLNRIPYMRSAIADKVGSSTDKITMDVIGLLFDYIFRDPSIPASLRGVFSRLQVPILKTALIDRSFFSDRKHPARRLLDHLAAAAIGATSDAGYAAAFELVATGVVDEVCREFKVDVTAFENADAKFQEFIETENRKAAPALDQEVEQALAGEETEADRSHVRALIRDKLAGVEVPFAVRSFSETIWADYLTSVRGGLGTQSDAWRDALQTLDDLLWSITAKDRTAQKARLAKMVPPLIRNLRAGGLAVKAEADRLQPFLEAVYHLHMAAIKPHGTHLSSVDSPSLEAVEPMDTTTRKIGNVHDFVGDMVIGTWLAFEGDPAPVNARLSWVSPLRSKYIFTSRERVRAIVLTPEELAWRLGAGKASLVVEPVPLFDRAVSAALDSIAAQKKPPAHAAAA